MLNLGVNLNKPSMEFVDYYQIYAGEKGKKLLRIKNGLFRKMARKIPPRFKPQWWKAEEKFSKFMKLMKYLSDPESEKNTISLERLANMPMPLKMLTAPATMPIETTQLCGLRDQDERDFSDFFWSMFGGQQSSAWSSATTQYKRAGL